MGKSCALPTNGQGGPPGAPAPPVRAVLAGGTSPAARGGGEGSGLGLYIVKYILEAHGGTVSARNDGGLVFELALPSADCEEGDHA